MDELGASATVFTKGDPVAAVLGVDISKAEFHCCLLRGAEMLEATFANTPAGHRRVLRWLKPRGVDEVHVCMEATGPYWRPLAEALYAANAHVSVVNPTRTAFFARSQLRRTKTDAVDARMLADFCLTQKPDRWEPTSPEILELRAFIAYRDQLVAQRVAQGLLIAQVRHNEKLRRIHAMQLDALDAAIEAIEDEMRSHVAQHGSLREDCERLQTIKGIGFLGAAAIVAYLPVKRLRDRRAAAAYAGLTPSERQSGTSLHGKPRICKTGNAELRRALYMPAQSAVRFNASMKAYAERQRAKGKPAKVIIVAVMRKLLVLAYTLLKEQTIFDPSRA